MSRTRGATSPTPPNPTMPSYPGIPAEAMARAFVVLRVFTGLVWLTNGLAKLVGKAGYDVGFMTFNLVDRGVALGIAKQGAGATYLAPLATFYGDIVVPHWGFFGWLLTVAELAIGLGLVLGVLSRLAAVGGLLLLVPIWLMLWTTNLYLWEYPAEDLLPLVLLAVVPAGRRFGLYDARLARHFRYRWPF